MDLEVGDKLLGIRVKLSPKRDGGSTRVNRGKYPTIHGIVSCFKTAVFFFVDRGGRRISRYFVS